MPIERLKYPPITTIPSAEPWTAIWKHGNKNTVIQTIQVDYPLTNEKVASMHPNVSNYEEGNYSYTFKSWSISKNISTRTFTCIASFTATRRYLWYRYNTISTTTYYWDVYASVFSSTLLSQAPSSYTRCLSNISGSGYSSIAYSIDEASQEFVLTEASYTDPVWHGTTTFPATGSYGWPGYRAGYNQYPRTIYMIAYNSSSAPSTSGTTTLLSNNSALRGKYLYQINNSYNIDGNRNDYEYVNEHWSWSILGLKYQATGSKITTKSSTNRTQYPDDDKHTDGYYYKYTSSTISYSRGTFIDSLYTFSNTSYTNNAKNSDGYWYVLQS